VAGDYFPMRWQRENIEADILHRLKLATDEEE